MEARCLNCNHRIDFRNTRGNRLSEHRCRKCGGKLERLNHDKTIHNISPLGMENTYTYTNYKEQSDHYFPIYKSKSGKFAYDRANEKWVEFNEEEYMASHKQPETSNQQQ